MVSKARQVAASKPGHEVRRAPCQPAPDLTCAQSTPARDFLRAPFHPMTLELQCAVREVFREERLQVERECVPRVAGSPEEWGIAWGFSGPKVRELVRRGLPHLRIGAQTRIMFDSPEVLAWLREHGDYLAQAGE